ncbi:efflux RND transporter periplasmic adaptor subunit [Gracilinema caldarium]|uniref:efflux RND transporter periplasmic adaptor subunit n=1 Tax=Gracilinema caldarium TaxID=215591 RepID=UPI0026EF0096|nr:efflux RND transporter periplasmic adaptor subunit [Gracilinema caldarium]
MKHDYYAGILIALVMLSSCGQMAKDSAKGSEQDNATQIPVFAVTTTEAIRGQIRDYLSLSGDLVSGTTVDAFSDVAGKVTKLYVAIGQRVQKDDPIAEVDPSRPGMSFNTGLVKAPISGTVVALPVQIGMTISQAMPVARLAGSGSLEARTYVAERFISKMKVGLGVELSLDAYPGRIFSGRVRELSPTVDPVSRTMEVRISVQNEDALLKPGMFAKLKIVTEEKSDVVKIPAAAIVRRYGDQYIFTVETDPKDPAITIAQKRIIVPGIIIDDQAEIRQGLEAGSLVVLRGQSLLEDGVRVRVVDTTPPLKAAF